MSIKLIIDENLYGHDDVNKQLVPVQIEQCCYQAQGVIFPLHWHEHLMLMYINKGSLILQCGKEKIVAEQGSVVVVNPNEMHSGETQEPIIEYYLIKIDLMLLLATQPDLKQTMYMEDLLKNHIIFENLIKDDLLLSHVNNIIHESQSMEEGYELAIRGLCFQILTILRRRYTRTICNRTELDLQYVRRKKIVPAITFMETHMADKITLDELSNVTHLSTVHFSRIFKNVSGYTPMDYLNQMRIEKAAQLLLKTDKTIVEIAMDTGFNDSNYFSRFFKKSVKVTPREYREKYTKAVTKHEINS